MATAVATAVAGVGGAATAGGVQGATIAREMRELVALSWPQIVSGELNFLPRLLVLGIVGHLPDGNTNVAAAGIGVMYTNMIGLMLIKSSSFGATPLYSQAFGAGNYLRVGQVLLRICLIHLTVLMVVSLPLTGATHAILVAVGQPPAVAAAAHEFVWWRMLGMPFAGLTNNLTAFLIAQRCVRAPMVANLCAAGTTLALAFALTPALGFVGAPIAMSLVEVLQCFSLLVATPRVLRGHSQSSWPRLRDWRAATRGWGEILRLGAPAAVMIISEWSGWECTLFIAGGLCNGAERCPAVEAIPICTTLMVGQFLMVFGIGLAAANRVGNLLGENKADSARCCAKAALVLIICWSGTLGVLLLRLRFSIATFFVDDDTVVEQVVALMPFTICYSFLATLAPGWSQQIFIGVGASLRVPAAINLLSFYAIGIPVGSALAFSAGWGVHGLWGGLVLGMVSIILLQYTFLGCSLNWHAAARLAREKAFERTVRTGTSESDSQGLRVADSAALEIEYSERGGGARVTVMSTRAAPAFSCSAEASDPPAAALCTPRQAEAL
jgi:MATE family multidrug resistance protein